MNRLLFILRVRQPHFSIPPFLLLLSLEVCLDLISFVTFFSLSGLLIGLFLELRIKFINFVFSWTFSDSISDNERVKNISPSSWFCLNEPEYKQFPFSITSKNTNLFFWELSENFVIFGSYRMELTSLMKEIESGIENLFNLAIQEQKPDHSFYLSLIAYNDKQKRFFLKVSNKWIDCFRKVNQVAGVDRLHAINVMNTISNSLVRRNQIYKTDIIFFFSCIKELVN